MNYNLITLFFPRHEEIEFNKTHFLGAIHQLRVAIVLAIILFTTFGIADLRLFRDKIDLLFSIRFFVIIPFFISIFLLSYTKNFNKIWQEVLLASLIITGTEICLLSIQHPENYAYHAGLILVIFSGYLLLKLRFWYASIGGLSILVIFNILYIVFARPSTHVIIMNNFLNISANLLGMFSAYYTENQLRRNYILNKQLDTKNKKVEELNKNLELKIEERTKELYQSKEKAEESDRLKSSFLANMSHEIRTPMNGILGFSNLLIENHLAQEKQKEYLEIIKNSGERLMNIINDIIDISKIEAGLIEISIQESNINEQLEYIYTFFKLEAEHKGLQISYNAGLPAHEAIIKTDKEKLYAILSNLVKNAIKYTNKGSIEFGYHCNSDQLTFYVQDSGHGIHEDRQEAIFERFIQADLSNKMAHQGAGLGLSISKAFIEMMGGNIWVESKKNLGSTFKFTLPYSREDINTIHKNGNQ